MAKAQAPSGTRDFLADDLRRRRAAFATVSEVFERFGFDPLETPAFERLEVVTGKYGEEASKLLFKILRRGVHEAGGQPDLALRYDHTVPLARVVGTQSARQADVVEEHRRWEQEIPPVVGCNRQTPQPVGFGREIYGTHD